MTFILKTSRGETIRLGAQLGKGGEGAVYTVEGQPALVGKLYHDPISPEKSQKLEVMTRRANPKLSSFAAWPQQLLLDKSGRPFGLVMSRIEGEEIHKLYGPVHRKQYFPDADWRFLVHTAVNCAAAFNAVHEAGCVVGDVNQGNLFVTRRSYVRLIDCDSFQIIDGTKTFRCLVGVPHFTPPELQGVNFKHVDRTKDHDAFGLAVLIFQLIAMGRHPFAGRYSGPGDIAIERAIAENRFAFARDSAARQMQPPPLSLPLSAFGATLVLFERAFLSRGNRPTAVEWHGCLTQLEREIVACRQTGHAYARSAGACPWCDLASKGAPDFFLSVALKHVSATLTLGNFDAVTCWRLIEAVVGPEAALPPNAPPQPKGRPLPTDLETATTFLMLSRWCGIGGGVLLAIGAVLAPFFTAWPIFAIAGGFWFSWLILRGLGGFGRRFREVRTTRRIELERAEMESLRLGKELHASAEAAAKAFQELRAAFKQAVDSYQSIRPKFDAEYVQLQSQVVQRQKEAFLESHFIDQAKIQGIGSGRKAVLQSYNIETANDITAQALVGVTGFGPHLRANLFAWRLSIEAKFRPDHTKGVSDADRRTLVHKYEQQRLYAERQLTSGPQQLRQISEEGTRRVRGLREALGSTLMHAAQAKADLVMLK